MRLLAVYGLLTDDYGWLGNFFPARRIIEECKNRSIPLRFLFPRDVTAFLDNESRPVPPESIFGHASAGEFRNPTSTLCLIRGYVDPSIIARLEAAGYRCINAARATALANDKLSCARFFREGGWTTPHTVGVQTSALQVNIQQINSSQPFASFPFVIKPRFGSRGTGVALLRNQDELDAAYAEANKKNIQLIAQEYVKFSHGRDVRFFILGKNIFAIAERRSTTDALQSNASGTGVMRLVEDSSQSPVLRWKEAALEIANTAGLDYGSVDFLYTSETELTVCEINASPGFEALETQCHLNVAGPLVDFLASIET